jgi:hypothetical protein
MYCLWPDALVAFIKCRQIDYLSDGERLQEPRAGGHPGVRQVHQSISRPLIHHSSGRQFISQYLDHCIPYILLSQFVSVSLLNAEENYQQAKEFQIERRT